MVTLIAPGIVITYGALVCSFLISNVKEGYVISNNESTTCPLRPPAWAFVLSLLKENEEKVFTKFKKFEYEFLSFLHDTA